MAEQRQERDMSGALFHATKKSEKAPDYRGRCTINGVELEIAGWKKIAQGGKSKGKPYLSLAFQVPRERPERQEEDAPFPF